MTVQPPSQDHRAGFAALYGNPNSGKSSLLNRILGDDLSIVSPFPQTTRKKILGIKSGEGYQVIFMDMPGFLAPSQKKNFLLDDYMERVLSEGLDDADCIILLWPPEEDTASITETRSRITSMTRTPVLTAVSKSDLLKSGEIEKRVHMIADEFAQKDARAVSSRTGAGVKELLEDIKNILPLSPPYYPVDQLGTEEERFFVAEFIRESVMRSLHEEIPYSTTVEIEAFKERPRGKTYIAASVITERESQKPILIGEKGRMIRKIGEDSRRRIESFLGREIYLELRVRVEKNWRKDKKLLKYLGYR